MLHLSDRINLEGFSADQFGLIPTIAQAVFDEQPVDEKETMRKRAEASADSLQAGVGEILSGRNSEIASLKTSLAAEEAAHKISKSEALGMCLFSLFHSSFLFWCLYCHCLFGKISETSS
jgi:hypothetical protein